MAEEKHKLGSARPVVAREADQPMPAEEKALLDEIYERYQIFRDGCKPLHDKARLYRKVVLLEDPDQDEPTAKTKTVQLQTLISTINNMVADQMDNMPEARMEPETPEAAKTAEDITDAVSYVLSRNDYEETHQRRVHDFFVTGAAVTQITWDDEADHGRGDIAVFRWPIEAFLWDPTAEDIQDARAVIKVSWHPLSWYAEHFPDEAPYISGDAMSGGEPGVPDAWEDNSSDGGDEDRAMLLEYWYRRYDAKKKKYTVSVAYAAGNALLYHQENVYEHGMYPFVLDSYDRIEGLPVGNSAVGELLPMERYVNRYARYIDENLRMAAKTRMLVNRNAGIDMNALTDWTTDIVEGENINMDAVKWFDTKPLSGMIVEMMGQFQTDIKQDSGQSQWTRGETAGGVTAAAAISALQEAGGKISRMRTAILNRGFKRICDQIMWLISQFYGPDRVRMIIGMSGQLREVDMSSGALFGARKGGKLPPPPYVVRVQIQRRNPLRIQAQNELFMQAYSMSAQAGQNFPLSVLFELLNVDGKEKITPILQANDAQMQLIQQQQMQMQAMGQQIEQQNAAIENMQNVLRQQTQANIGNTFTRGASATLGNEGGI